MQFGLVRLVRLMAVMMVGCGFQWQQGNSGVSCFETFAPLCKPPGRNIGALNKPALMAIPLNLGGETATPSSKRRLLIGLMLSIPFLLPGPFSITEPMALAAETTVKKPFAPLENLLPAIRVKRSIDSAIDLTRSLVVDGNTSKEEATPISQEKVVKQLESLLLKPQSYIQSDLRLQGVPSKPANLYLKDYRSSKGDLPFQKMLIESGDVDAWKRLKRREKNLEKSDAIRQALNAYTDALSFSGDSYLLKVDAKTKSSMVREDRLPDVKQVITSDMGMRYLYRNQVLTAMDEIKAELEYQLSQDNTNNNFDGKELLDLLGQAKDAMDRWLSLVPSEDVEQALQAIANEPIVS